MGESMEMYSGMPGFLHYPIRNRFFQSAGVLNFHPGAKRPAGFGCR